MIYQPINGLRLLAVEIGILAAVWIVALLVIRLARTILHLRAPPVA